ncbi:hypothetical protein [Stenotrophomonas maltophilia]|uniref:hypothetical protein n=1 Tax=Stenotrophomonas maltophilia TaxID=40324 RepID=UPI002E79DFD7|nr:hypothetical protein [Stenotrophomonas maltophilia]
MSLEENSLAKKLLMESGWLLMSDSFEKFSCIDFTALYGSVVSLRAFLVVRGRECFLVDSRDHQFSDLRMDVCSPGLERLLDEAVGGWVGGVSSYFDEILISGVVREATTRRDLASIAEVSRLTLFRDELLFEVIV